MHLGTMYVLRTLIDIVGFDVKAISNAVQLTVQQTSGRESKMIGRVYRHL